MIHAKAHVLLQVPVFLRRDASQLTVNKTPGATPLRSTSHPYQSSSLPNKTKQKKKKKKKKKIATTSNAFPTNGTAIGDSSALVSSRRITARQHHHLMLPNATFPRFLLLRKLAREPVLQLLEPSTASRSC